MPTSWLSWKRSLACKTQLHDVHDPQSINADQTRDKVEAAVFVSSRRLYLRSGCSRSIANLRDVIHSSRRMDSARVPALPNFSPKSVESNDFVQSISHEAMLHEHGCSDHAHFKHAPQNQQHHRRPSLQGKLTLDDIVATHHPHPFSHPPHRFNGSTGNSNSNANAATGCFYGTPLHPSAHPPANAHPATPVHHSQAGTVKGSNSFRKLSSCYDCKNPAVSLVAHKTSTGVAGADQSHAEGRLQKSKTGSSMPPVAPKAVCQRCGETFPKYEALEQHHLFKHAVAELDVGDSSRNVVEIIFRTSWLRPPEPAAPLGTAPYSTATCGKLRIERVLKVNNLARTLARFEDYREGVKMRASKLPKKHPRCLADGNELLRFYGERLECELLQRGPAEEPARIAAASCSSTSCVVCKIIRSGFPKIRGPDGATNRGILTTATSGRAHQIMTELDSADSCVRLECTSTAELQTIGQQDGGGSTSVSSAVSGSCILEVQEPIVRSSRRLDMAEATSTGGLMAMLVCRVIAGRVHKPPPTTTTTAPPTPPHSGDLGPPGAGFDSVAGGDTWASGLPPAGMGLHSRFEELTVFNPRAILPCFVVLYRC